MLNTVKLLVTFLVAAAGLGTAAHSTPAKSVIIRIERSKIESISTLSIGLTLNQGSKDPYGDKAALNSMHAFLSDVATYQNTFIMGSGAANPNPAPDLFKWGPLDNRLATMRETHGIPVVTLCCAPDWMKGGVSGQTDWSRIEEAPNQRDYGHFAALAAEIAKRYPDIKFFQVWSELKGFYDKQRRRWNYEAYTQMYNQVYTALKQVSASAQVGGPYVALRSLPDAHRPIAQLMGPYGAVDNDSLALINYWLKHKVGAEFISLDGSLRAHNGALPEDLFAATTFFKAVALWVKQRTSLPIWWSEWYPSPRDASESMRDALAMAALMQMVDTADVALLWGPEDSDDAAPHARIADLPALWSSTLRPNGGKALPFYSLLKQFETCFPRGTPLLASFVSSSEAGVLASENCVLFVNHTSRELDIESEGQIYHMGEYQVLFTKK